VPYRDKEAQREYQRRWMARRREDWLSANGPCVKCGSWDDLEVDHIDPSKKVSHKVWSWREDRRLEELAKCQVLCRNCHYAKTYTLFCPKGHMKAGGNLVIHVGSDGRLARTCRQCKNDCNRQHMRRKRSEHADVVQ